MLTYWRVRSAFKPQGALPSAVIQGFKAPSVPFSKSSTPRVAGLARLEFGLIAKPPYFVGHESGQDRLIFMERGSSLLWERHLAAIAVTASHFHGRTNFIP
jgi:hypothetical protein